MGRAAPIQHPTSHIIVAVGTDAARNTGSRSRRGRKE
jgi:hypothetical protein